MIALCKPVKRTWQAATLLVLLAVAVPASGADDSEMENLALCKASWMDWKSTAPDRLENFENFLHSDFSHADNDAFYTPKSEMTVAGLKVINVFPGSLGIGLGFSVLVDASFDVTRQAFERRLGLPLGDCETSDGMRMCEHSIAEQRTVMLASNDPPNDQSTLAGCYYFYEK